MANTQAAGVVQFLFDLQVDTKNMASRMNVLAKELEKSQKITEASIKSIDKGDFFKNLSNNFKKAGDNVGSLGFNISSLTGILQSFMAMMPIVAAIRFDNTMARLSETIDVTGGKMEMLGKAYMASLGSFRPEQVEEAIIAINRWGTMSYDANVKTAKAVLQLTRYTDLNASSAAELYHKYVNVWGVYSNVTKAQNELGATMAVVSRNYNLSASEMVSALSTFDVALMRTSASQRSVAQQEFLRSAGVMNELGVSAQATADIIASLSDYGSEAGNRIRAFLMGYSGEEGTALNKWLGNPGEYTKELLNALQKAVKHPDLQALAQWNISGLENLSGIQRNVIISMREAKESFGALYDKQGNIANALAKQREQEAERQATFTSQMQAMANALFVMYNQIGTPALKMLGQSINRLIPVVNSISVFLSNVAKSFNTIANVAAVILLIAGLILVIGAFVSGGWIAGVAAVITKFLAVPIIGVLVKWTVLFFAIPKIASWVSNIANWLRTFDWGKIFNNLGSMIRKGLKFAFDTSPMGVAFNAISETLKKLGLLEPVLSGLWNFLKGLAAKLRIKIGEPKEDPTTTSTETKPTTEIPVSEPTATQAEPTKSVVSTVTEAGSAAIVSAITDLKYALISALQQRSSVTSYSPV